MLGRSLNPKIRHSLWVAVGFLCCALIAFGAIVQVAHTHANGQAVQSDCALCYTAHAIVQPSAPQSLPHKVRIVATVSAALQPVRRKRFSAFSLFTRPPPVHIAFA
jgi:hypothetical protein